MANRKKTNSTAKNRQVKTANKTIRKPVAEKKVNPSDQPQQEQKELTQEMFDERWQFIFGDLESKLKEMDSPLVIAFVFDTVLNQPMIMSKGHLYEVVRVLRDLHSQMTTRLVEELSIERGRRKGQSHQ